MSVVGVRSSDYFETDIIISYQLTLLTYGNNLYYRADSFRSLLRHDGAESFHENGHDDQLCAS